MVGFAQEPSAPASFPPGLPSHPPSGRFLRAARLLSAPAPTNSTALEWAENQRFNGWSLFRAGQRLNGKALSIKAFFGGRKLTRAGRFAWQQAEGPDASPFGELAVGPSGGGHNSRPPPVRSNGSLCPCHLSKGFAVPHTSCSGQASVSVQSVGRYGRKRPKTSVEVQSGPIRTAVV